MHSKGWTMIRAGLVNWSIWRVLRLGIGIYVGVEAFHRQEWYLVPFGVLLLIQAITNTGCAGGNCAIPANKTAADRMSDTNGLTEDVEVVDVQEVEVKSESAGNKLKDAHGVE